MHGAPSYRGYGYVPLRFGGGGGGGGRGGTLDRRMGTQQQLLIKFYSFKGDTVCVHK